MGATVNLSVTCILRAVGDVRESTCRSVFGGRWDRRRRCGATVLRLIYAGYFWSPSAVPQVGIRLGTLPLSRSGREPLPVCP